MSQPTPEGREIDSRLEELDRRLRAVQDELLPERESRPVRVAEDAPPPPPPRAAPPPPPPPLPRPAPPPAVPITAVHSKLISSLRDLLDAYESLLTEFPPRPPYPPAPGEPEPQAVSAGPFPDTDAVRAFRDSLAALPGVETVAIRAYEGQDRAIFDIKLLPDGSA
jgi:hypothetical protein